MIILPGRICSTTAYAVPRGVWPTAACATSVLSVYKSLCCTCACLSIYMSFVMHLDMSMCAVYNFFPACFGTGMFVPVVLIHVRNPESNRNKPQNLFLVRETNRKQRKQIEFLFFLV
jgi:hypothetical protein